MTALLRRFWLARTVGAALGVLLISALGFSASNRPTPSPEGSFIDGAYRGSWRDFSRREQDLKYRLLRPNLSFKRNAIHEDMGNIAVIQDDGTIVFPPNTFDLDQSNIRFVPNGSTYQVIKMAQNFDPAGGSIFVPGNAADGGLDDDDAGQVNFSGGFAFTFYGQTYSSVWVNSDGDLTFTGGDPTSDDRDVSRFLARQPRIAPFFTDLEPNCTGNRAGISTLQEADRFIVLYNDVPRYSNSCSPTARDHNTFEVILYSNGTIEFSYNGINPNVSGFGTPSSVVGIAPGQNQGTPPSAVDYTLLGTATTEPGAIDEFFTPNTVFSSSALTQRFYQTHGDDYDFITVFTDFPVDLGGNTFAFEQNVSNQVTGIGLFGGPNNTEQFDLTGFFGSAGRLESYLNMGYLGNYPSNPNTTFLGTNSTLEVMGQEFGHRWMAFADIPGATCNDPQFINSILGRDCAHWSFFFNSHGSVMEGNDIVDNGNGTFTTTSNATSQYSDLDQYLMGFRDPSEVQPTFVVFNPSSSRVNSSAPAVGVTFSGTRHTVTVDDLIQKNGLRNPSAANSPHHYRQAWVLLIPRNGSASAADLSKIDTIRQAWQSFFQTATSNRGFVDTTLPPPGRISAAVAANNGASKTSLGQGSLSVAYGQIASTTATPPAALANFGFTQNGVLTTEAGVAAASPTTAARIPVDYNAATGADSGVAVINTENTPITVNVQLIDASGANSTSCPPQTVAANGHFALFASTLCPSIQSQGSFLGSMTLTSSAAFVATDLEKAVNAHGEQLYNSLPVSTPNAPPAGTQLYFSQFADGGGFSTEILLMNVTGAAISGTVGFFDDNGNPVTMNFSGLGAQSTLVYALPGNALVKYVTTGTAPATPLQYGDVVVTSTSGALPSGAVVFSRYNAAGGLTSQAGVLNSPVTTNARMYVNRSSTPLRRDTGVAIVNPSNAAVTVTMSLVSLDGSFNQPCTLTLPAKGHVSKFIGDLFAACATVPANFEGVLTLTSGAAIAPVTLRLTTNQRYEDLYSTLPVVDLNNPPTGPQYLPQIADGGGYTTQIILVNTTSSSGTVTLSFFDDSGSSTAVPFQ